MLRKYHLYCPTSCKSNLRAVGIYYHAFFNLVVAGGNELILALYFNYTDTTGSYFIDFL